MATRKLRAHLDDWTPPLPVYGSYLTRHDHPVVPTRPAALGGDREQHLDRPSAPEYTFPTVT